mmetsp:Transcript_904/g.2773  ORF Transcript_904/g.2773 Transcript_904/m.2773 type:complete len:292 (-) Transcript_904:501-1376(-)
MNSCVRLFQASALASIAGSKLSANASRSSCLLRMSGSPRVKRGMHAAAAPAHAKGQAPQAQQPPQRQQSAQPQQAELPPKPKQLAKFCRVCGGPVQLAIPEGDDHWRHVCQACGAVEFYNPKMVVGCIVEHGGRVLLCRRAIDPCAGKWTLPAGYLELSESTAEGAARETREEACADVRIIAPFAHYDIPVIGQTYLIFRAAFQDAEAAHSPGPESLETCMMSPAEVPWDEIAFSSISLALRAFFEDLESGKWHHHHAVIDKRPGSSPNDPGTFQLRDHITLTLADTDSRL